MDLYTLPIVDLFSTHHNTIKHVFLLIKGAFPLFFYHEKDWQLQKNDAKVDAKNNK